jgi:hypothetical protein
MVVGASAFTKMPLHLVSVSNRLHRSLEKTIGGKLQIDFAYVMLVHNKWGVLSRQFAGEPGQQIPGGLFHA